MGALLDDDDECEDESAISHALIQRFGRVGFFADMHNERPQLCDCDGEVITKLCDVWYRPRGRNLCRYA